MIVVGAWYVQLAAIWTRICCCALVFLFLFVIFVVNRFCEFLICIFLSPGIHKVDKTVDDSSMLGYVSDLRFYAF